MGAWLVQRKNKHQPLQLLGVLFLDVVLPTWLGLNKQTQLTVFMGSVRDHAALAILTGWSRCLSRANWTNNIQNYELHRIIFVLNNCLESKWWLIATELCQLASRCKCCRCNTTKLSSLLYSSLIFYLTRLYCTIHKGKKDVEMKQIIVALENMLLKNCIIVVYHNAHH